MVPNEDIAVGDVLPPLDGRRFTDRIVVVTGAAAGIGRAIAERLHAEGAVVAAVDFDEAGAKRLAEDLGDRSRPYFADVGSATQISRVFGEIRADLGDPEVLINNAAYLSDFGTALNTLPEQWDAGIAGTLSSVFRCCREILPAMIERRRGSIVNVASVLGVVTSPAFATYSAGKGGVISLTKSLAVDYGNYGIRANAVSPGAIDTPNNRRFTHEEIARRELVEKSVLGRIGEPREIAAAAAFLASDDASFITGANLLVDGGYALR